MSGNIRECQVRLGKGLVRVRGRSDDERQISI